MNISAPFIQRPIATALLMVGLLVGGLVTYLATIAFTAVYVVLISVQQSTTTGYEVFGHHLTFPNVDYGGILAGYVGGWVDQAVMRLTDAWLALPFLMFAIFLAALLGAGVWNIVIVFGLVYWTRYARVIRGEVLSLREREFVRLAQVAGVSTPLIILRHILPNVLNTWTVLASLTVGVVIVTEASLSFLGVGVPPPTPAWGLMLSEARSTLMAGKWWLTVFPGLCIMMVVLATQLLGDWLRIRLDPQLRNL